MRARDLLKSAAARLTASGSPDPEADAQWLVSDALRVHRGALALRLNDEMDGEALRWFEQALARRETGEPLQYVEGFAYFYGRQFLVDRRVLIPRSDTETLLEAALERIRPGARVLDLCTGSGILAISLALSEPGARLTGADISGDALDVARENARRLGASVEWVQGDLFDVVAGSFDLIACNPPYLTAEDMETLQKEVSFEPALALCGGRNGLDFYRRAVRELPGRLNPGGSALFEVGIHQAGAVSEMLRSMGAVTVIRDLGGVERVVALHRDSNG